MVIKLIFSMIVPLTTCALQVLWPEFLVDEIAHEVGTW